MLTHWSTLVLAFHCPLATMLCYVSLERFECYTNQQLCTNPVCNFTLHRPFVLEVHDIGCNLTKAFKHVKLRVRHEIKVSRNRYKPGIIDFEIDICDLSKSTMMRILWPNLRNKVVDLVGSCPIQAGPKYGQNLTFDPRMIPATGQLGEYRMTHTFISGRFLTIFKMSSFGNRCLEDNSFKYHQDNNGTYKLQ